MESNNLLFEELMAEFDNLLESAVRFLVTYPEHALNLWTVIYGIAEFYDHPFRWQ
jgi:hypothetical protein|tara:strand:- start:322 stop:486 length:165 start_codon:yes stop_codon:yes gene_type:complete